MFTWLKNKLSAKNPETDPASSSPRKVEAVKKGNYLLEPLEPRILLSADSIFSEVYRSLQDDEAQDNSNNLAIIIEEIDAALFVRCQRPRRPHAQPPGVDVPNLTVP